MAKTTNIYRVHFGTPPLNDGKEDYYYSSLAAIYEQFTEEQVGVTLKALWSLRVTQGEPYIGRLCTITLEALTAKPQAHPKRKKTGESVSK